eukprot:2163782-Pyramimonas_sp.AAC.2
MPRYQSLEGGGNLPVAGANCARKEGICPEKIWSSPSARACLLCRAPCVSRIAVTHHAERVEQLAF